jgi:hypothetical protein
LNPLATARARNRRILAVAIPASDVEKAVVRPAHAAQR